MNTEQILKALDYCLSNKGCYGCPYEDESYQCDITKDSLALIKSQQGQIVGLNSAIETLQGVAKDYENHNENLAKENKYLRESLADEREHKEDMEGK